VWWLKFAGFLGARGWGFGGGGVGDEGGVGRRG